MKALRYSLLITLFLCSGAYASVNNKVVLVANIDSNLKLSKQEIQNLFMGGFVSHELIPVAIESGNPLRTDFNLTVIGLTESRVQSYWAQMKFTGRKKQPITFENQALALSYVVQNENTVTYVSADQEIPDNLVVIYE